MSQNLDLYADVLYTITLLLQDHECKMEEIDGFPIRMCKICAAQKKAKDVLLEIGEEGR